MGASTTTRINYKIDAMNIEHLDTTESLLNALLEYQVMSIQSVHDSNREPTLLTEIVNRIDEFPPSEEDKAGYECAKNLKSLFGTKGLESCLDYWAFQDAIRAHQKLKGISGVFQRTIAIADETLTFPEWDNQLLLLDSDLPILKSSTSLVDWLYNFTNRHGYELLEEIDDKNLVPVTGVELALAGREASSAWIDPTSHNWIEVEPGEWAGQPAEKFFPDKLTLGLTFGRPDDENTKYFAAHHPDKSRFPWLN